MDLTPAKTGEHEPGYGQIDHGFARLGLPLVFAIESAKTAQPTKRALYDPAPRQHLEGVGLGPLHDLDSAAPHFAAPIQQGPCVASVGPNVFDPSGSPAADHVAIRLHRPRSL